MAFEDSDRVFWWPKVADTVIEARFSLLKYTDITSTCSILKPLLWGFSLHISARISGYGGLRTFVESDRLYTLFLSAIPQHKLPLQHRVRGTRSGCENRTHAADCAF
jgi:hypothetical protein